jgi:nonsense-mediated mRNA decay protein 3
MEYLNPEQAQTAATAPGTILCCQCGTTIEPNAANMCVPCIRGQVDITEAIPKQATISHCKGCERYLQPPGQWIKAPPESRELLGLCLKKLKGLSKLRLVDAGFIWTEPHSKRIRIKLTVQAEVMGGAVLQQIFTVEFTTLGQVCDDCRRADAKDYWKALVQVRQKSEHKKTMYYLEQLILKYRAHKNANGVKPHHDGLDFYYSNESRARKMVDFLSQMLPCQYQHSKKLISHDTHSNTYNYKFTFSVEIVPICKDSIVCLPTKLAHQLGGISQICIVYRVTNAVHLIDPATAQVAELSSTIFWRNPFGTLCSSRNLTEFIVMEVEPIIKKAKFSGQGSISERHLPADIYVVKANAIGENPIHCRSHLGHLLNVGDTVLGFDMKNTNINDDNFDKMKPDAIPDIVLVKKIYSEQKQKRRWKLRHFLPNADTASVTRDYEDFLQDLEEDPAYRESVNIYKDSMKWKDNVEMGDTTEGEEEGRPRITLQEMLDDLTLSEMDHEDEIDVDDDE